MTPLPEPRSHTGCPTCTTARCCVAFDPELTGSDLLRLLSFGLEVDDVAELRPTHATQAGPDAIHLGDACAWDLRLRRTGAPLPRPDTTWPDPALDPRRCGFLMTFGAGRSRCGVYAQRPMACRLFPSAMTPLGVFVATPEVICPPGAFAQERSDLATLTTLHRLARLERDAFRFFLAAWNRLSPTPPDPREALFLALLDYTRRISPLTLTPSSRRTPADDSVDEALAPEAWHEARDLALAPAAAHS